MSELAVTFTREQIAAYAEASGDHNPIHLDDDFARKVGLPGVIAHGMLQMGLMATVASEAAGGGTRLRRLSCRFAGMVVPGDTVTFMADPAGLSLRGEDPPQGAEPGIAGSRRTPPRKLELRAVNQRGEPVLTKSTAEYS